MREACAPLLGARISRGELHATDETTETLLRAAYRTAIAQDLLFERALAELAKRLPGALLLKGAALRRGVFGPGERSMCDVDVLVPRDRWRTAIAAAGRPIETAGRAFTARHDYAVAVEVAGVPVEIHRFLCPRPSFRVDYDGLFLRASNGPDGLAIPAPEDLFVSLALHAAKHGWALPFRAVLDGLALAPRVDPTRVVTRACAWRARRAVATWLTVLLAHGLDPRWRDAATHLGAAAQRVRWLAAQAPFRGSDHAWQRVVRVAGALDGLRGIVWLGQRSAFRMLDCFHG